MRYKLLAVGWRFPYQAAIPSGRAWYKHWLRVELLLPLGPFNQLAACFAGASTATPLGSGASCRWLALLLRTFHVSRAGEYKYRLETTLLLKWFVLA